MPHRPAPRTRYERHLCLPCRPSLGTAAPRRAMPGAAQPVGTRRCTSSCVVLPLGSPIYGGDEWLALEHLNHVGLAQARSGDRLVNGVLGIHMVDSHLPDLTRATETANGLIVQMLKGKPF